VVVKQPNDVMDTGDFDQLAGTAHPNVVKVFACFHNPVETYVVMECCAGGDLFGALESVMENDTLTQNWCAAVMQQAVRGVNYIHVQFGQSHNDIKPENILCEHKPTSSQDVPRVMIADFGCCAGSGEGGTGDPRYMSPQGHRGYPGTFQGDVWSLGVTMFELVTGGLLIYTYQPNVKGWSAFQQNPALMQQFFSNAQWGSAVDIEGYVRGERAKRLLSRMLVYDPAQRNDCESILRATWFNLVDEPELPVDEEIQENLANRAKGSGLRVGLLNLIGSVLQGEAIAYYGHLWEKYDSDGDGLMYIEEFTEMMQKQFGLPCPRDPRKRKVPGMNRMPGVQQLPSVEEIFNYADTEGNGFIDFNEFVGIMFDPDRLPTDKKRIYFKSAFSQIAGEDNKITMDELDAYFGGDQDTSELFAEMDNGDGIITFREFEKFVDKI